jgi:hypothetical protein
LQQDSILAPIGALVLLTFVSLMLIPIRRFQAGFAKKIRAEDFKYGESGRVPGDVAIPNRNYMNLLEAPLLFYVLCILELVTNSVTALGLVLAWIYVGLRVVHSAIHLTYNNVGHRLVPFATSNVVLLAMWILFFARYYART